MMTDDEYFNDPRVDELGRALAHANDVNASLQRKLTHLEKQNAADHRGFIESRRSIVDQRDALQMKLAKVDKLLDFYGTPGDPFVALVRRVTR